MDEQQVPKLSAVPTEFYRPGDEWVTQISRDLMKARNEVYALFGRAPVGESPIDRDEDLLDDDPNRSPLHTVVAAGHSWIMDIDEFMTFDRDSWLTSITEVADAMAEQLVKGMLAHIGKVSDDYGMSLSAEGRDPRDALLDALDEMEISFDETGAPNLTFLAGADAAKKFREPLTEEQQLRHDEILNRKREAWHAARRRGELP